MQDRVNSTASADAATAAAPATNPATAMWQRALTERLAQHATPHDIATYLATHRDHQREAMAFLTEHMGNAFVQKVIAATPTATLTGQLLVSNNPEGISTPGVVMSSHAKAGSLAAYIHHSNHTKHPLDMFLVVKPSSDPVNATLSGTSAATGGSKRAEGGRGEWAADPNVVVAAASEAARDGKNHNAHNRTSMKQHATGPTPIKLGTLPAGGSGDPPLFDARYDIELSGDAELTVVAGDPRSQTPATGNTKYELAGTNGRAAGMYEGARFATDDTAQVSQLPFKKPLTGSKFAGAPSPKVEHAQRTVTPSRATLAARPEGDAGAVYVLEHAFRIAPSWLREKGVWDGTRLTTTGLSADYATLITELKAAKDSAAFEAVIAEHPTVGAGLDAASYGTMFDVGVLIENDTRAAADVSLDFLTDAAANRAGKEGAVFRGVVSVDGVDHAINNDTASHHASHSVLERAHIEAGHAKYVHVHFQSPGQISAGQELDIKKK